MTTTERKPGRPSTGRPRRTSVAVREAILTAAAKLFAEGGYANVSTRQIADAAGVAEPLLFRHFSSKANLFEITVLAPLAEFVTQWAEVGSHSFETPAEGMHLYIQQLYAVLRSNKGLVLAALAAGAHEDGFESARSDLRRDLSELFRQLAETVRLAAEDEGWNDVDPALTVRLTFGMVLSAVVFDEWLFAGRRPPQTRMLREIELYLLHGIAHRPDPLRPTK